MINVNSIRPVGGTSLRALCEVRPVPPVAKKVYIQVNQAVDGWESLPRTFWGIVPAAA